jgi:hypothetical protein
MTRSGSGTAKPSTTSTACSVGRASRSSAVTARTVGSSDRTTDGLNPGWTSDRYRVWAGGSVCIIVGGLS